jgi:hypothetical protein
MSHCRCRWPLYHAANDLDSEYSERDQLKLLGLLRRFRQLIAGHATEIRNRATSVTCGA